MNARQSIVVSDLHLHAGSDPAVVRDFARLLRANVPCTLVLNGDVFDLDQVAGERQAGLETTPFRLMEILGAFPGFAEALRGWADRGGTVVWLPGNHDAEVCLPEVRTLLRKLLGLPGSSLVFEDDRHVDGPVHVEHGHQRDPDNRFFPDTVTAVARNRLSALPLGCLTTRYLLCRIPEFQNRGDNHMTPLQVLGRVVRNHGWSTPRMVLLYVLASLRIALQAFFARRRGDNRAASPWQVLHRMYIDRVALAAAFVFILILSVAGVLVPGSRLALSPPAALAAGLPCALLLFWPPSRRRKFEFRDRRGCLRAADELLGKSARVVVMGHVHHDEAVPLDHGLYLNTGAFYLGTARGRPYVRVDGPSARLDYLAASR